MVVILPDTVIGQIIKLCLLQKYNRPKLSENLALRLQENSCEMRFLSVMYTYLLQHKVLWKCTVLWELEGKWGTAEYICFRTAKSQGEVRASLVQGGGIAQHLFAVMARHFGQCIYTHEAETLETTCTSVILEPGWWRNSTFGLATKRHKDLENLEYFSTFFFPPPLPISNKFSDAMNHFNSFQFQMLGCYYPKHL